ncbi:ABC transporter ATP-binding protein [Bogoriella caseilytica]|uniref:Oligopeptide transport system ATP-binding protein n=1 Tax=Bogoriella caseilytica TaxID=56055 RepID=A0A3N2BDH0_9MICO|nr:oligopeptide/dipeptide ABC transporter ATP-binding protein [Bogoriella caseilytica]ROR73299.1 oligopeptide transport system ATP-binding protein [Bogoriella caseilytica]
MSDGAVGTMNADRADQSSAPSYLVEARDLKVQFRLRGSGGLFGRTLTAVDDISFGIRRGETLGMVGESGSGKSTTGRGLLQLDRPASGSVRFDGVELTDLSGAQMRAKRRRMQMIFQDPYASLNPRMTIGQTISDSLMVHRIGTSRDRRDRIAEILRTVGLNPDWAERYPHEFSGGQRQRTGIARALAVNPDFVVADEPVSALDVSVQAQTINLLESLQDEFGITFLFIAHDLAVVRHLSDRIAVMYLGKIVELADRDDLYVNPAHPYTHSLLSAVPIPDPVAEVERERIILRGDIPSPLSPPSGCRFRTRCWKAEEVCGEIEPPLVQIQPGHEVACHFPETS